MERAALLDALVDLAREAGITVRRVSGDAEGGVAARSGACRIRGAPWLLLAPHDPLEERIAAAAAALADLGEDWREGRFLAPALREAVERAVDREARARPAGEPAAATRREPTPDGSPHGGTGSGEAR